MEKRAAFRFPTDLEADCRCGGHAWSARLFNISTTGCMVACPDAHFALRSLIRLRVEGLPSLEGAVVWQHKGYVGLRFLFPLQPANMEHMGFHLPDGAAAPIRPHLPLPPVRRPAPGLHGQLVKRTGGAEPSASFAASE